MLEINEKLNNEATRNFKPLSLFFAVLWGTISNPIVFMTVIGVILNFLLNRSIPWLIEPLIKSLGDSFNALALFYLGYLMVNRIKNLNFNIILIITILIFVKSLVFPLLSREFVFHIESFNKDSSTSLEDINSLSSYAFLYGTFPSAPSLYFYITKYKLIAEDIISPGLVFGTLVSVPLMIVSAKMITFELDHKNNQTSIQFNNNSYFDQEKHFENISCKISLLSSFLSLFCLIWVSYLFITKLYCRQKPHFYTLLLNTFTARSFWI